MIDFYQLNESEVLNSNGKLPRGSFICCKDSSNIYIIPKLGTDGTPVKLSDTIKILTEAQRKNLLTPINEKMYFCYDTGKMWVYYNDWFCLSIDDNSFDIDQVVLPASTSGTTSTVVVSDSRIKAGATAEFVPDPVFIDLVSDISTTVAAGKVTVTGTTSYAVQGTVKIK